MFVLGAISIHALREEGDDHTRQTPVSRLTFLSTPSARRATKAIDDYTMQLIISIHALREEGDATFCGKPVESVISIHALREEGDLLLSADSAVLMYFYPRPPRGGRPTTDW